MHYNDNIKILRNEITELNAKNTSKAKFKCLVGYSKLQKN